MGKGPTRRPGPGKASDTVRALKRGARDVDPHTGKRRGGYHDNPAVYDRKDDDTRERLDEYQTPESRAAVDALFNASSEELGAAALAACTTGDTTMSREKLTADEARGAAIAYHIFKEELRRTLVGCSDHPTRDLLHSVSDNVHKAMMDRAGIRWADPDIVRECVSPLDRDEVLVLTDRVDDIPCPDAFTDAIYEAVQGDLQIHEGADDIVIDEEFVRISIGREAIVTKNMIRFMEAAGYEVVLSSAQGTGHRSDTVIRIDYWWRKKEVFPGDLGEGPEDCPGQGA